MKIPPFNISTPFGINPVTGARLEGWELLDNNVANWSTPGLGVHNGGKMEFAPSKSDRGRLFQSVAVASTLMANNTIHKIQFFVDGVRYYFSVIPFMSIFPMLYFGPGARLAVFYDCENTNAMAVDSSVSVEVVEFDVKNWASGTGRANPTYAALAGTW